MPCASPLVGALLAYRKLETLGFVYVGELGTPLRNASSSALPPQPLERLGQRPAAGDPRLLPRDELADGEVRLLLAGARPAEGHAPDLHYRPTGARVLRAAPHLARRLYRRPVQEGTLPTECRHVGPPARRPLDGLLEGVARAEGGYLGGLDLHPLAGLGVPSLPGLALPDGELPEARDPDLVSGLERRGHDPLEGPKVLLGFARGHAGFLGDPLDELRLVHGLSFLPPSFGSRRPCWRYLPPVCPG